jgi:hypothetical protein
VKVELRALVASVDSLEAQVAGAAS